MVRRLRMVSQTISGRPRVTVLPYYEGPPSVAGRDRTKAGEIPPDQRDASPCPAASHGPGDTNRRSGAPGGAASRDWDVHEAQIGFANLFARRDKVWCAARRSAPSACPRG